MLNCLTMDKNDKSIWTWYVAYFFVAYFHSAYLIVAYFVSRIKGYWFIFHKIWKMVFGNHKPCMSRIFVSRIFVSPISFRAIKRRMIWCGAIKRRVICVMNWRIFKLRILKCVWFFGQHISDVISHSWLLSKKSV